MQEATNSSSFNLDEFSKKAEVFYTEIKAELEAQHKGKYAAIDAEDKDTGLRILPRKHFKAKKEFPSNSFIWCRSVQLQHLPCNLCS